MSVLRTVAAAAAFACFVSAQGTYSNSTTAPAAASVAGWKYDGCVSTTSTAEWTLAETASDLTIEDCLLDCSAYTYAAIHSNQCYCGQSANGTTAVGDSQCFTPCPGNAKEACGGQAGVAPPTRKRQTIVGGPLYSLYEKAIVPAGDLYVTVITNVYVDVCNSCEGGFSTCTYSSTATLTGCGCPTPSTPAVPLVTTAVSCDVCGTSASPAVVTLTIPSGITPGLATPAASSTSPAGAANPAGPNVAVGSTVSPPASTFTGAASSLKQGAAGVAGAVFLAAAML